MASDSDNGLATTLAAFDRVRTAPRKAVLSALVTSAHQLADAQEELAEPSRDTGALINSIAVTPPGQSTPAYSQPGGSRVAGETEVIVTAGDAESRYAHLIEFGTAHSEAQPFFWPAYRLLRQALQNRIARAAKKAVKDAWNNQ